MNLPADRSKNLTHSSQEREAHREWIGGRAVTLLSHYWREDDPVELTAAIGRDWADVLEGLPQEYIQRACVRFMRENPDKKPKPGNIYDIASGMMPKPEVASVAYRKTTPEEDAAYAEKVDRSRINEERAEQAARIIRNAALSRQNVLGKGE